MKPAIYLAPALDDSYICRVQTVSCASVTIKLQILKSKAPGCVLLHSLDETASVLGPYPMP